MTPAQRTLARHALGLDNPDAKGRSYRNRYYTSSTIEGRPTQAWQDWTQMVKAGEAVDSETGRCFGLTLTGALLALDPGESLDREDFPDAP